MPYETILGGTCFTASEKQKLLARLNGLADQKNGQKVKSINGRYEYYVNCHLESTVERVKQLVLYENDDLSDPSPQGESSKHAEIYITPRNISPWSSQATAIAHVCGLKDQVVRIERGRLVVLEFDGERPEEMDAASRDVIHDRMTEHFLYETQPYLKAMFSEGTRQKLQVIDIFNDERGPLPALQAYNQEAGLGLAQPDMEYLVAEFKNLGRAPNDVELFMYSQVNSEHCRHHVFNAKWLIDGERAENSLFGMIRNTHKVVPDGTISAYSDNAAVMEGEVTTFWAPGSVDNIWRAAREVLHPLIKVETHNHPTAISPFPGAATGSGGEIRDEGAVGRGSSPKAGLVGFWTSDLLIPAENGMRPWETDFGRPAHYASSLDIMLDGPIGAARFNNEFGRPSLTGVFRTLLTNPTSHETTEWRGYHKPIMIAGGIGSVRDMNAIKKEERVERGAHVIVLGGPAMLIGLGGGAASSAAGSEATAELDFNSVQRGNPEMERRAQQVINTCVALGEESPIAFIHDVGAGGLSNALPELVKDAGFGGEFELRKVDSADDSMSPLQIWCNEAQERYVLLVNEERLAKFASICERERCGFSDVGTVQTKAGDGMARLVLTDRDAPQVPYSKPIDLPMEVLFPPGRKIEKTVTRIPKRLKPFDAYSSLQARFGTSDLPTLINSATELVFNLPSVGSKMFLITIGDRTVGGLTGRDQLVGPWQTPVADVAVTAASLSFEEGKRGGDAMAMGEKPTLAIISPAASARMAVVESLMNLGAAHITGGGLLKRVKLSANWMAAVKHADEGAELYDAVHAIGMELCPKLGVSIPVGKDSTSMKASWRDKETGKSKSVTAPVSVVISSFSLVEDVRKTWTPQLQRPEDVGQTALLYVDLAQGHQAMGGSALAQCLKETGNEAPDVRDPQLIKDYFDALHELHREDLVLAYHDISDGGLITTIAEMMFAGRCGAEVSISSIAPECTTDAEVITRLFNEELGAIFQVRKGDEDAFAKCFATCGPPHGLIKTIGYVTSSKKQSLTILHKSRPLISLPRSQLQQWWSHTTHHMQTLRDNPLCAASEHATLLDDTDPGLSYNLTFNPSATSIGLLPSLKSALTITRPRVAILREQGVNGHAEMAYAFRAAGFDSVDVHMSDILDSRLADLSSFVGLACCGGFSYGDVLGAGQGWAQSILLHPRARAIFSEFFMRKDTFTLGVCNGCQMLTKLSSLIPGAEHWPTFTANTSTQFEARFSMVSIPSSVASVSPTFFDSMSNSFLPITISHGEGRATFTSPASLSYLNSHNLIPLRYTDNYLNVTEAYPFNPNGSPEGVAGVMSADGRVVAMMPHPERTVMGETGSWVPGEVQEGMYGPWMRLFVNARRWVG